MPGWPKPMNCSALADALNPKTKAIAGNTQGREGVYGFISVLAFLLLF
jgi:hypothetical protein